MPELLFHGAAREVTGSMHMVHVDDRWVALDCGLFQGKRSESEAKNREWPMPPSEIAAVVLSHAHTDHTGRLPKLVKDGFDGPIFCTPATRDLCSIMLPDSAYIQEEDVAYVNKKRKRKKLPPIEALYEHEDAVAALKMFQTISYGRLFQVVPGLLAEYQEAGHMLGSAGVRLYFGERNNSAPTLYFTGDIGRPDKPILRDPAPLPEADILICESTYGGTVNERVHDGKEKLTRIVRRTYERGGKVIILAFSVGRTQTIVYFLHQQMEAGVIPRYPVYIDSPLAANATEVFRMHPECYDTEARQFQHRTGDMLGSDCCEYTRDVQASKAINRRKEPCTIISASGMCEAGRIRHHIKNNIENPKNTILIVGWQAAHTLGRRLLDGVKEINIFHDTFKVKADIEHIHGFSAHADQADLLKMLTPTNGRFPRKVFLVHGEEDESEVLADKLRELGYPEVTLAERGMKVSF